jgi:plastocyanin
MTGSALHLAGGILAASGEPSKTPFYIAGSLFAVWAVVLSAIGLRNADFPATRTIARVVMGISAIGILATTSLAVATSTKKNKEEEGEAKAQAPVAAVGKATTNLALATNPSGQLQFDKKALAAKSGKVTIALTNDSEVPHNVAIEKDGKKLETSETITKSKTSLTVSLAPGEYTFFCAVDAHRQAGMQGKLTVQ